MKQAQGNRWGGARGGNRGRKPQGGGSNRSLESNGPDVKVRGSASHIHDRYVVLARDARAAGDAVLAEGYLQHAEHYQRLLGDDRRDERRDDRRDDWGEGRGHEGRGHDSRGQDSRGHENRGQDSRGHEGRGQEGGGARGQGRGNEGRGQQRRRGPAFIYVGDADFTMEATRGDEEKTVVVPKDVRQQGLEEYLNRIKVEAVWEDVAAGAEVKYRGLKRTIECAQGQPIKGMSGDFLHEMAESKSWVEEGRSEGGETTH